jgi:CRP-like cAMP-binding protein
MNYPKSHFSSLVKHLENRAQLTEEQMDAILDQIEVVHLKKREVFLKAGEVCKYEGYINRGCIRVFFTDHKAHEHVVQLAFEDWWIADLMSFFTGLPANYSIEALEETELFLLERSKADHLFKSVPPFETIFRILLQSAYVSLQKRVIANMSQSAEERYLELTRKYPQMELRVAQHHIASYLGITPEALSRIRKNIIEKMKKQ